NYSIKLVWETGSYLLAASWFLAAGFTLRTSGHVRISILTAKLPPALARPMDILATAGGLVICTVVWLAIMQLFIDSVTFNKTSFTPMQTPLWIPQSFVVIGATLLLLTMVARLGLLLLKEEPDLPFASDE
ncbi:MAG: TRAP transporter small permease, partial [Deltaproteobacteria bacterium]|nr:TRAP transporter small permease [Deltaproteobacteria bacterium]